MVRGRPEIMSSRHVKGWVQSKSIEGVSASLWLIFSGLETHVECGDRLII